MRGIGRLFQRFAGDGLARGDQKTVAELIPSPTPDQYEEGWCLFVVGAEPPKDLRSQGYYQAMNSVKENGKPSALEVSRARMILSTKFGYFSKDLPPQ